MNPSIKVLCLILALSPSLSGQTQKLSQEAQLLSELFTQLKSNPTSAALQSRYLLAFPETASDFGQLFDPQDFSELYDGYEYIILLKEMMTDRPWQVGCLVLNLAKEAKWRADAFNYLQQVTAQFALTYTIPFVKLVETYTISEQNGIISFLADGIHSHAKNYFEIIERLRELGQEDLAQRFVEIEERMREDHQEN